MYKNDYIHANYAAKVLKKMRIRKQSEKNYKKIIDFNLFYSSIGIYGELAHE